MVSITTMYLAKRAASITLFRARFLPEKLARFSSPNCLSTSFERPQGSNAAAEMRDERSSPDSRARLRVDPDEDESGAAHFMADTVNDGVKKATKTAETVGDAAKKKMDEAWRAAKDGSKQIGKSINGDHGNVDINYDLYNDAADPVIDEIQMIDGPVDMAEYRAIGKNIEDLKRAADKAHF